MHSTTKKNLFFGSYFITARVTFEGWYRKSRRWLHFNNVNIFYFQLSDHRGEISLKGQVKLSPWNTCLFVIQAKDSTMELCVEPYIIIRSDCSDRIGAYGYRGGRFDLYFDGTHINVFLVQFKKNCRTSSIIYGWHLNLLSISKLTWWIHWAKKQGVRRLWSIFLVCLFKKVNKTELGNAEF